MVYVFTYAQNICLHICLWGAGYVCASVACGDLPLEVSVVCGVLPGAGCLQVSWVHRVCLCYRPLYIVHGWNIPVG